MNEPTIDNLAQRLDCLERRNRRLKMTGIVLFLGIAALISIGQNRFLPDKKVWSGAAGYFSPLAPGARVIKAERFELLDKNGNIRAELGTQPDGSAILAFVNNGKASVLLRGVETGPRLHLTATDGAYAGLSASSAGVVMAMSQGKSEVSLVIDILRNPSLGLIDKDGKVIWSAP